MHIYEFLHTVGMVTKKERELIVRWHNEGKRQQQIAALLGCNQGTVSRWIRWSKTRGHVNNLKRSGRPTKLTRQALDSLRVRITDEVMAANKKFCSLNTKQLAKIIRAEIGEQYSMRHVERVMHKIGFSRVTPRSQHLKNDPAKVAAFREEFKKNFNRNTWIMSL